ncbi:hypothetical protein GE09DRAFT_1173602 [Coniochaeta sp. 2T2.1]|nr:hypothetical protein GE09DRAFT_1173602 [Coniochaeta sp. 2T2.1]
MSEVQSRPAASRGRGPARGGRGGFTSRGGSRVATQTTNGDSHQDDSALEDEGEIGQLKQKFGSKIGLIKEMFPTWSDIDILYALQEADGDENLAVTRIADGTATQWGEVSKQKKAPKTKKADAFTTTNTDSAPRAGRGGRGDFGGRGRGRVAERGGRGGARGKPAHAPTNGIRSNESQPLSVPTEESSAWETPKPADDTTTGWGESTETSAPAPAANATPASSAPTPSAAPKPSVAASNATKTWASMLRQPAAPKPAPKPKEAPAPKPAETVIEPLPPAEPTPAESEPQSETPATHEEAAEPTETTSSTIAQPAVAVPETALAPSNDQLTEKNLDQLADDSHPPPTETAASEAADSWNPRGADVSATATPLSGPQQKQEAQKTVSSGYAATALKATERAPIRTPSYQRRVLDQEEAVRMPGNRDQVDRAAVQFGAFSLNEDEDDIDGDREEPETRAQPPVDSPVTQPRASLPPVQPPASLQDSYAAQKPVSSLPTGPAASAIAPPSQPSAASQGVSSSLPHSLSTDRPLISGFPPAAPPVGQNAQQYGRFGQSAPQEPAGFGSQKPFDAFGQQQQQAAPVAQNQYEGAFGSQAQVPPAQSQAPQQPAPGFSSAPSDYSSYYTAGAQDRSQYNYYNQFAPQQGTQGPPEGPASQQQSQRSYMGGNYNAPSTDNLSQYPQSSAHTQRYGSGSALDNSGNTTPNPSAAQAPPSATGQAQPHGQQPHDYQQYSQNHPYFNSPYYAAYMNQYQGYGGQGGYGGVYGKGSPYGQPGYGMNAQGPYAGHGTSPAAGFAQSSLHRADSGGAAGLAEYGRAPSAQAASQPALGGSGYGGMHDSFSRGGPYSQGGQSYNTAGSQPGNPPVDDLKQFGDAKTGAGPSPSMGLAARPGSATNNAPSSGLPPAQSGQQGGFGASGYGNYPGHSQGLHGAQAGASGYGMGASGNQGQHGNNPYGGYGGQGFGGGNYGYGNQQQRGGWGGNYH